MRGRFLLGRPLSSLSVLTAIFSGGPGLADTRMSLGFCWS